MYQTSGWIYESVVLNFTIAWLQLNPPIHMHFDPLNYQESLEMKKKENIKWR